MICFRRFRPCRPRCRPLPAILVLLVPFLIALATGPDAAAANRLSNSADELDAALKSLDRELDKRPSSGKKGTMKTIFSEIERGRGYLGDIEKLANRNASKGDISSKVSSVRDALKKIGDRIDDHDLDGSERGAWSAVRSSAKRFDDAWGDYRPASGGRPGPGYRPDYGNGQNADRDRARQIAVRYMIGKYRVDPRLVSVQGVSPANRDWIVTVQIEGSLRYRLVVNTRIGQVVSETAEDASLRPGTPGYSIDKMAEIAAMRYLTNRYRVYSRDVNIQRVTNLRDHHEVIASVRGGRPRVLALNAITGEVFSDRSL